MPHEVVTFGEAMLRLTPPAFHRLEQATSFDIKVGGAELNTAVGLVRLGRSASWVSRLTANPLGRLLAHKAREAGVGTDHILWTDQDRVGLYFLEMGAAPRSSSVVYDRRHSAIASIEQGMIHWDQLFPNAKWFHFTGITPALSQTAAAATTEAIRLAREIGIPISIDLNYRAKLWTAGEAREWMTANLPQCDVLITTEEDAEKVLGVKEDNHEFTAQRLADDYNLRAVAITIRENPLVWRNRWMAIAHSEGQTLHSSTYEVEIVDRLGAGDSFSAGFIHGLLDNDLQMGLDYGVALSALKHTIPGDFAWATRDEVEALIQGGGLRIAR